ncbi:MAG: hypothetical protein OQJ76_09380, partial [Rhodospirillales bacterium]|nr:hypothetical protein [Rhodospirillales bacterium]
MDYLTFGLEARGYQSSSLYRFLSGAAWRRIVLCSAMATSLMSLAFPTHAEKPNPFDPDTPPPNFPVIITKEPWAPPPGQNPPIQPDKPPA